MVDHTCSHIMSVHRVTMTWLSIASMYIAWSRMIDPRVYVHRVIMKWLIIASMYIAWSWMIDHRVIMNNWSSRLCTSLDHEWTIIMFMYLARHSLTDHRRHTYINCTIMTRLINKTMYIVWPWHDWSPCYHLYIAWPLWAYKLCHYE